MCQQITCNTSNIHVHPTALPAEQGLTGFHRIGAFYCLRCPFVLDHFARHAWQAAGRLLCLQLGEVVSIAWRKEDCLLMFLLLRAVDWSAILDFHASIQSSWEQHMQAVLEFLGHFSSHQKAYLPASCMLPWPPCHLYSNLRPPKHARRCT